MKQKALDLGPLPPCPYQRGGRHDISIVLPRRGPDATLFCSRCGSARRVSLLGPVRRVAPLDDRPAADIADAALMARFRDLDR